VKITSPRALTKFNSEEDESNTANAFCERPCSLVELNSGEHIKSFSIISKIMGTLPVSSLYQDINLYSGDTVSLNNRNNAGCESGYKMKNINYCVSPGVELQGVEFLCKGGVWEIIDTEKETCRAYCNINDIVNLSNNLKVKKWNLFNSTSNSGMCSGVTYTATTSGSTTTITGTAGGFTYNADIYSGEYIRGVECENGYSIPNVSDLPYYRCGLNGQFEPVRTEYLVNNNSCKRSCQISSTALGTYSQGVLNWEKCDSGGGDCTPATSNESIVHGSVIKISECATGMALSTTSPSEYECNNGTWRVHEAGGICATPATPAP
jgi:hypothetical protein